MLDWMLRKGLLGCLAALALSAPALAADPRQGEQWGLAMVEAPDAWGTSTGVGAVVAVIDTGVDSDHPDLTGRLLPGFDFVGNDPVESGDEDGQPEDGNGHGTHVSGIVAAVAGNGEGIAGVAPGAQVLPYRVLDDDGRGYPEDVTKAIDRAIAAGADVINLSLGDELPLHSELTGDPGFEGALERAIAAGIVVVLAGGNSGLPLCENPDFDGILCVGAVDRRRTRSVYSSFGPDIDVMAPGGSAIGGSDEDILSTWLKGGYDSVAGTSQATPHVAGVAALVVSLGVRGKAAAGRILETATDAGAPGRDDQYGHGIVNARAAVAGLGPAPPPPDPDPRSGSFTTKRKVKAKAVKRRGIRVRCNAVQSGTCVVRVRRKGKKIARGRAEVAADTPTLVVAKLNRRGRRIVSRIKRRIRVSVRVALPGEPVQRRGIRITR